MVWLAPVCSFLFLLLMTMLITCAFRFGFWAMPHTELKVGLRLRVPVTVDELYTDETQAFLAEKVSAAVQKFFQAAAGTERVVVYNVRAGCVPVVGDANADAEEARDMAFSCCSCCCCSWCCCGGGHAVAWLSARADLNGTLICVYSADILSAVRPVRVERKGRVRLLDDLARPRARPRLPRPPQGAQHGRLPARNQSALHPPERRP